MFKTRLLSGIVLVAVALLTIISGGYVLFFTLLGISLIGMQELYKVMHVREDQFNAFNGYGVEQVGLLKKAVVSLDMNYAIYV